MGAAVRTERDAIVAGLVDAAVVRLEAPGGFGKTTVARALADRWGSATVVVDLEPGADIDAAFAAFVAGTRRSGLTDFADAIAGADPAGAAETIGAAIGRGRRLTLFVDEVQFLDAAAAAWLAHVVTALPEGNHVVLAGRHLPGPLRAPDGDAVIVGPATLRYDESQVAALLASRLDSAADEPAVTRRAADVMRLSAGWPVAVDLLAGARVVNELDGTHAPESLLAAIVAQRLATVSSADQRGVIALAAVPLLSAEVAAALGAPGALGTADRIGLPLIRRQDGWLTLPDPVRDALAAGAPDGARPGADQLRAVAACYCRSGELAAGVQVLYAADDRDGVAAVLVPLGWTALEAAGVSFARLVAGVVEGAQSVSVIDLLVALARAVQHTEPALRRELLDAAAAHPALDPARGRVIAAERAIDCVFSGEFEAAGPLVVAALDSPALEPTTRARALYAAAVVENVKATAPAAADAARHLGEAAELAALVGEQRWRADALVRLGYAVHFHGGDVDAAVAPMAQALDLTPAAGRARAMLLIYLSEVLDFVGRTTEADAAAQEALAIGRRLRHDRIVGLAAWSAAIVAAHTGDRTAVADHFAAVTATGAPWLETGSGFELHLGAADLLLALGDVAAAMPYYEMSMARATGELVDAFAPLQARYEAMFGDPARGEELLVALEGRPFSVARQRWNRALMRAFAALRRGDRELAQRLHRDANALAALTGYPDVVARHERWIDEQLRVIAPASGRGAEAGVGVGVGVDSAIVVDPGHPLDDGTDEGWYAGGPQAGATDGKADGGAVVADVGAGGVAAASAVPELQVLGTFALFAGGTECTPPHGNAAALLKLLALRRTMVIDEVVDAVWPDVDIDTGRARLRNTLNRLRSRSGEVVVRRGDSLILAPAVRVDVDSFEDAADQASTGPVEERAGAARRAVALYRGELLPGDRYADWAAAPRERLRRRYLALVDLLADDAERRGDLDEAVRQLDAAIAADPLDERRPVRAATLLLAQGRRTSAREVVARALASSAELAVDPSRELRELGTAVGLV